MIKNIKKNITAGLLENKTFCFLALAFFFTVTPSSLIQADEDNKLNDENIAETRKVGCCPGTYIPGAPSVSGSIDVDGILDVPHGGTGDDQFTPYALIAGGVTDISPLQSLASVGTTNQVVASNGAGALPTFKTLSRTSQVFTTAGAGVYTPSAGMVFCVVEAVAGGGGAGGVAAVTGAASAGGGSSNYSRRALTSAQMGATTAYIVGTGGLGGAAGANPGATGTASTFGGGFYLSANPGLGSLAGGTGAQAGGTGGSTNTTGGLFAGFNGQGTAANSPAGSTAGAGANTPAGFGAGGYANVMVTTGALAGNLAQGYGAGGGGAVAGSNTPGVAAGGTGSNGIIIVTEYCIN